MNLSEMGQVSESVSLNSRKTLIRRLKRSPDARAKFVDSHINKTMAFQIRALRGDASQQEIMEKLGMNQNAISRLENPYYGKATLTTLKRIAAAHDVGLLVEFVPFSRLIDRASGTPFTDLGLGPAIMNVRSFQDELPELESSEEPRPTSAVKGYWDAFKRERYGYGYPTGWNWNRVPGAAKSSEVGVADSPVTSTPISEPKPELQMIQPSQTWTRELKPHRTTNRKFKRSKKRGRGYAGAFRTDTTTEQHLQA